VAEFYMTAWQWQFF